MSRQFALRFVLVMGVLLALATPAWAGGWAVVTLDQLPAQVVAGQPLTIGFMVRQHGQTPRDDLAPKIMAVNADTQASFTTTARPQGEVGHYAATLTFPNAGTWNWSIDAFGFAAEPMPALTVLAALPSSSASASAPLPLLWAVGIVGLIGAGGALLLLQRTRAQWAAVLMLAAALVGGVSLAAAANPGTPSVAQAASSAQVETGKALFLAKGCVMCHPHSAVAEARKDFADFSIGPDLTHRSLDPYSLRRWLKNPSAVKPGTQMPTLGLSDDEIEALIAFLNASTGP